MINVKCIIYICLLVLSAEFIAAQKQHKPAVVPVTEKAKPYDNKFVRSCDANGKVVNLSAKMHVAKLKLANGKFDRGKISYSLKSGSRKLVFSVVRAQRHQVNVWIDEQQKHCFSIDPRCNYSFQTYSLSKESLEVYGVIRWGKLYKNFRVIFSLQKSEVLFDFDDEVLKQG